MAEPTPPPDRGSEQAAIRYAHSGDVSIAYRVGPSNGPDLVYVSGWVSHLDMMWQDPWMARFLDRLASFSRLITFDKRGVGLSDRVSPDELPTLEERMDDVRAVLEAVGSTSAFLFGHSEGSMMSALYAATYPDRTSGLVLFGSFATRIPAPDYPWAPPTPERLALADHIPEHWPDPEMVEGMVPSMAHEPRFMEAALSYFRSAASPASARALLIMNTYADVRAILPSITAPCLVLHNTGDIEAHVDEARWIAEQIPNARFIEYPGDDHVPWTQNSRDILDDIEEFVTGDRIEPVVDRVLATVMFTDIVDSTRTAAVVGDAEWRRLVDRHDAITVREIDRHRGTAVKSTGDGYLATFDGPARGIRCAVAITDQIHPLGIDVRAGLHTGEIELRGDDIGGLGVHIASRVEEQAEPGTVVVSRTVRDLVSGSGISFTRVGIHALRGVPGEWELYAVSG